MVKKHQIVTLSSGKQLELPKGIRKEDILDLELEEHEILLDLKMYGRRTRRYYLYHHMDLSLLRRLKSRGFVVSVKLNSGYAYDLSHTSIVLMQHGLIG